MRILLAIAILPLCSLLAQRGPGPLPPGSTGGGITTLAGASDYATAPLATANTPLANALAGKVSVITGADPTGVADSTSAINTAISALTNGGVAYLATAGTYKLTGSGIALSTAKVTLLCAKGAKVLAPLNNNNAIVVSAADVTVDGCEIDGQYASQTNNGSQSSQDGIYLATGSPRFTFKNGWIHDTCGMGISNINYSDDMKVLDSRVTNGGVAASQVQATPAPTTTTFATAPGTSANFVAGQSLRIGTQTGAIVSSVQTVLSAVAVTPVSVPWSSATAYVVSDIVSSGGNQYISILGGTNHVPPNVTYWTAVTNTIFKVNAGQGANFATSQVIHVGSQTGTISAISVDTLTLTAAITTLPTIGQIVAIDNITLTGAITTPSAGNVVAVTGGYLKGIYVAGATKRPVIKNTYLTGWSQAIGLWYGVRDALVEGNSIVANYGYEDTAHTVNRSALELYPANNVGGNSRVAFNLIDGATHNTIECAQGEVGTIFFGNTLRNWAAEVGLGATGEALELTGQAGTPGNTTDIGIVSNTFSSNGAWVSIGIQHGSFVSRVAISANRFTGFSSGTAGNPIQVGGGDSPAIIGNTFSFSGIGVQVNNNTGDPGVISANIFNNCPTAIAGKQISLTSAVDGWVINGNTFNCDNVNGPLAVLVSSGNKHRITNNHIKATTGISVTMNDGLITGNELAKGLNDGWGAIRLVGTSARNIVRDNTVQNTPGYTISLEGTADYNRITGNQYPTGSSGDNRITTSGTHNIIQEDYTSTAMNEGYVAQAFSATPIFNLSFGTTFNITLTGNVTSSTAINPTQGRVYSFVICQDGTGSWTFVWPTNMKGAMTIGSTLSTCNSQSFAYNGTNLYALSAGVTNQ